VLYVAKMLAGFPTELTVPAENPKSDELSENKDDGDRGSGFKLNAGQTTPTEHTIHT